MQQRELSGFECLDIDARNRGLVTDGFEIESETFPRRPEQ
jgi:hypothetical protein